MRSRLVLPLLAVLSGCTVVHQFPAEEDELTEASCTDGTDNDLDGRADCYDPDCVTAPPCQEACTGGIDEDLDGRVDCGDDECVDDPACVGVEEGPRACTNGLDDDRDGIIDCLDPDCVGACPEDDATLCGDGLDNDADGRIDGADAGCWSTLAAARPLVTRRCGSVAGNEVEAPLAAFDDQLFDEFYLVEGTQPEVQQAAVIGSHIDLGVGIVPSTLGLLSTLNGRWEGLEIELLVRDDVEILLAPAALAGIGTPALATTPLAAIRVERDSLGVSNITETRTETTALRTGWGLLRARIEDGAFRGTVTPLAGVGSGEVASLPIVPLTIPESGRISDVRFLITGDGGISRLRLSVPPFDPCGEPLPGPDASPDSGLDLSLARSSTGMTCALTLDCRGIFAIGSSVRMAPGRAFAETFEQIDLINFPGIAVGLAWDQVRGRFRGVFPDRDSFLTFIEGDDCAGWERVEVETPPALSARYLRNAFVCGVGDVAALEDTVGYVIEGDRHEIYWRADSADGGAPLLLRGVSTDGGRNFDRTELPFPELEAIGSMLEVIAVGNERVILRIEDPSELDVNTVSSGLGVRIGIGRQDGRYEELPLAGAFRPTGVAGTYDRDSILAVSAVAPAGDTLDEDGVLLEIAISAVGDVAEGFESFSESGTDGRSVLFVLHDLLLSPAN